MSTSEEFIFTWKIENFHMLMQENGENIISPTVSIKQFFNSEWCLDLYPRGEDEGSKNCLSCYLVRNIDDGPKHIEIDFELSINSVTENSSHSFVKDEGFGFYDEFKLSNKSLHENVCVIVCHMRMQSVEVVDIQPEEHGSIIFPPFYKPTTLAPEIKKELASSMGETLLQFRKNLWLSPRQCLARTRILVERRSITCSVKDIARLERTKKLHLPVLSCSGSPGLLIILHKTVKDAVENVEVNLCFIDKLSTNYLLVCEIQTLDFEDETQIIESSHLFKSSELNEIWNVDIPFKWCKMMKHKNASLKFNFSVSDGKYYSDIESCESEDYDSIVPTENLFPSDLFRFYTEKKFCDVTLQVRKKFFEAHKTVLCSMSPVFSAMFEVNMKEKLTDRIVIKDLDSETVSQMLTFLYSGRIEQLEVPSVIKLFTAADKYQILLLKIICRNVLQKNLSIANIISILKLADTHQDNELKESAAYFAYKNAVFLSQEWKQFSVSNPQLALEVFQNVYSKYL